MKFLGDQEPWSDITKTLENDRSRVFCAIGYIGINAWQHLPLKEGDLLVCDASYAAIKSGACNPKGLIPFIKAGVNVFTREGLHAKVIASKNTVWIGSNNASDNSAKNLIEAAVRMDNAPMVKSARDFIVGVRDLSIRLEQSDIQDLIKLIPKRKGKGPVAVRGTRALPETLDKLFIVRGELQEPNEKEKKARKKVINDIKAMKHRLQMNSQLDEIYWFGSLSAKPGDWVVALAGPFARSPAKILDITGPINDRIIWLARPEPKVKRVRVSHLEELLDRSISDADSSTLHAKEAKMVMDYYRD